MKFRDLFHDLGEALRSAEDEAFRHYVHMVNAPEHRNKTPEGVVALVAKEYGLEPRRLLKHFTKRARTKVLTGKERLFPDDTSAPVYN